MSIRVVFPEGITSVTAPSLYQWDYGQTLEVEVSPLSPVISEIHFSCLEMDEALVQPCSFANGVATASIPDTCLEQTTPVTAWIYEINGNSGNTTKSVKIPMIARPKPSVCSGDVSPEICDKYTEAITEMNAVVAAVQSGDITASNAENARHARDADRAQQADLALFANEAQWAERSDSAIADGAGNNISETYLKKGYCLPAVIHHCATNAGGEISPTITTFVLGSCPEGQTAAGAMSIGMTVTGWDSTFPEETKATYYLQGQKCTQAKDNGNTARFHLSYVGCSASNELDVCSGTLVSMNIDLLSVELTGGTKELCLNVISGNLLNLRADGNLTDFLAAKMKGENMVKPTLNGRRYSIRSVYVYFR